MAITVGTRYFSSDASTTSHSFSVAITANAKVVVFIATESATNTISSVQFNGSSMSLIEEQSFAPGTGQVKIAAYYIDTALGASSYNLTYTTSETIATTVTVYPVNGAAAGAPEGSYYDTQSSAAAVVGDVGSVTVTAGAYLMSCSINSAVTPTVSVSAGVTKGDDSTSSAARVANAADIQASGGAKTTQWTYSTTSTTKMMMAVSVAAAVGGALSLSSISGDNEVSSAEADFAVVGSGLSAGQTFTLSGIACTELSFSGSTSVKLTAPNFISNNIKFGKVEFKVSD